MRKKPSPKTSPEACNLLTILVNNKSLQYSIRIVRADPAFAYNHVNLPRKHGGLAHDGCVFRRPGRVGAWKRLEDSLVCTSRALHAQILTGSCTRPTRTDRPHNCTILRPQHVALAVPMPHVVVRAPASASPALQLLYFGNSSRLHCSIRRITCPVACPGFITAHLHTYRY